MAGSPAKTPAAAAARRILIVDDEPAVRRVLREILGRRHYQFLEAIDGPAALRAVRGGRVDVVLFDLRMPRVSIAELLRDVKQVDDSIAFVVVTGAADLAGARELLQPRADDYLLKPFDPEEVRTVVERALRGRDLLRESRAHRDEAARAHLEAERLRGVLLDVVAAISRSAETFGGLRSGDGERVGQSAVAVGRALGLAEDALGRLWMGGLLRDVGNLALPAQLLSRPGRLSSREFELVKRHPVLGASFVERSDFLRAAVPAVLHHHERWDGSGYPYGLAGDVIPLEARVLAVADAFHAMRARRPYRAGGTLGAAVEELRRCAGTQFDAEVVRVMLDVVEHDGLEVGPLPALATVPAAPVGAGLD